MGSNGGDLGFYNVDKSLNISCRKKFDSNLGSEVSSVCLTNNESSIVTVGSHKLTIWDTETLKEVRSVKANSFGDKRNIIWKNPLGKLYDCVDVNNGPVLAISGEENLFTWDSRSIGSDSIKIYNSHRHEHHDYCIKTLQTRGNMLYSGGGDSFLCTFDLRKENSRVQRIRCGKPTKSCFVSNLRLSGDNLFAALSDRGFKTFGVVGGEVMERGFNFSQKHDFAEPKESSLTCFDVIGDHVACCFSTGKNVVLSLK